jgi:hypothetical protein
MVSKIAVAQVWWTVSDPSTTCFTRHPASTMLTYGQSISRLQQGSTAAATTLLKVMVDVATPPSTRVRAAEAVPSHAAKAIEIEDIDARLRELEKSSRSEQG